MSKYYRAEEVIKRHPVCGADSGLCPVEVDEWHPASEPPTPEDFEPTGFVAILRMSFTPPYPEKWASNTNLPLPDDAIWREITPPTGL